MARTVALLLASASALVPPAAAPARPATRLAYTASEALPFMERPASLDELEMAGDVGFDPFGFSSVFNVKWLREAEIKHGRVAMLATIGYTYPEMPWFAQAFPGDAYSHSNPIKAALAVPPEAWAQVLLFCGVMEWSLNGGASRRPRDFR